MVGKPFLLEPWEKFIYSWIYGWVKENEKGQVVRVTREAYVQIPKEKWENINSRRGVGICYVWRRCLICRLLCMCF